MDGGHKGDEWLRWFSFIVPGMSAALAWKVTAGLPLLNRFASGIAIGLVIYVILHFAIKGFKRRDGD
jgi:hypothetical protein